MRKLAFSLLWFYVLSIPLERTLVLPGLGTITKILGGCALIGWFVIALQSGSIRRPALFHLLFFAFAVWGLLSYAWSIDPTLSWPRMVTRAQLPVMIWLIWELASDAREQRTLMQAYCLGSAVVCVQVLSNYSRLTALVASFFTRYSAFDVDPNMTALRISLAVPMAIYLAGWSARWWLRWFNWLLVPTAALAVVLTGSRSGVLAMIAALMFLPFALTAMSRSKKLFLAAGIVASVVAFHYLISPKLLERIMTIPGEIQTVVEGDTLDANVRVRLWQKGLAGIPDHLMGGVGIGAFRASVAQDFHGGLGMSSHNTYLAVLVEEGLIGFGLFMSLLGVLAVSTRHMPRLERSLFLVLLATWGISVFFIQQHDKQHTWFLMAIIATYGGSVALERAEYSPHMLSQ